MSARSPRRPLERLRAWWRGLPIMRAFFCFVAIWAVASLAFSLATITVLMEAFYRVDGEARASRLEVNGGPYIYDARNDELVPASAMDLNGTDQFVFIGFTDSSVLNGSSVDVVIAGGWNDGVRVGYATMDMVRTDDALTVYDWGGNYTEEDYIEADGNPYREDPVDPDDLAAYDARERATRVRNDQVIAEGSLGEGMLVSNVGYYVSQDDGAYATGAGMALRIAAGLSPFLYLGVFAIALFRRFYRTRLEAPLDALRMATDRVARQDLDFEMPQVAGRELGGLARAFERMRASLVRSQRELWRTAEERRRLNAAFAHDLRTPVTVLKGTVEMAQMRAEHGEAPNPDALRTIAGQVGRLESYATAMSGIARLEDRKVVRAEVDAPELARDLAGQARAYVSARAPELAVDTDAVRLPEGMRLLVDRSLVEEVLDNLLSNACGHAGERIEVSLALEDAPVAPGADPSGDAAVSAPDGCRPDGSGTGEGSRRLLALRVSDDGPGFTPEALRRGCEPFFGEAKSAEHFGLGLNIVQTLTRLHGGAVELANADGRGAVVTVRFEV